MEREYRFYVGIDWATEAHQACVVGPRGQIVAETSFVHSGAGLAELVDWLVKLGECDPSDIAVAIEISRGPIVDTLVERGFAVYALNPKQLDRFRDRHTVAGAKDDRRDAFVLGDSLRTDQPCFRSVRLDDPLIVQLREISRVEEDLGREVNRLANRLREQLHRFYPQMLRLCAAADERWLWALLERAPTPAAGEKLPRRTIERLLREHRIRKHSADEIAEALKSRAIHVAPGVVEAATEHIALLLARLRLIDDQRRRCEKRLGALLDQLAAEPLTDEQGEHRDVEILRSLPGVGRTVVATVLGEASSALAARDYHALRAHAGSAPVTKQSGKHKVVHMRYACNGRLRHALHHWARVAAIYDPSTKAYYRSLRHRGHSHARALRSVSDRNLRILFAMLRSRTLYQPERPRRVPLGAEVAVSA